MSLEDLVQRKARRGPSRKSRKFYGEFIVEDNGFSEETSKTRVCIV